MHKTLLISCALLLAAATHTLAQERFDVPQRIELNKAEDYPQYEPAMVAAAHWLETTPLNQEADKRLAANRFVLQWIAGSPDITVELKEAHTRLTAENPELLVVYLASYARHYIQNRTTATPFSATRAALQSVMTVYSKGIRVKKSKELEKLLRLQRHNKLEDYIRETYV